MEAKIQIQDINSNFLVELTEYDYLNAIFGGATPTTETTLANDIGWAVGRAYRWVASWF
ncbi:hypothetical protein [Nodularia chucula]|uniref:hypothetical protein n=1 Tax=Nodularia chucula TaxID=3093667 RepID=UPI0039C7391D